MNVEEMNRLGFFQFIDKDGQFYWKFYAELCPNEEDSIIVPEGATLLGSIGVSKQPEDNWTIEGVNDE